MRNQNIVSSEGKKYLTKNIGFLTISQFGTKILNFLLVPLYTNILTTAEYGEYDLIHASVGIIVPLLTINIWEAVLRFSLDDSVDKAGVFSFGLRCLLIGSLFVVGLLIVNAVFGISAFLTRHAVCFAGLFFVQAATGIVTSFARGVGQVAQVAISGVLCTAVIIVSNILFLCIFDMGLNGYLLANIIGPSVQLVYLFWRIEGWRYIKLNIDKRLKTDMTHYSIPTILNAISWWVNGWADRYAINWLCGISANGIYAVASKIPSILNVFQNIFNQAWTLSSVKEFDTNDRKGFFSEIYNQYNCLLVILCSIIIMFDKILARILYAKEFYAAWKFVPFLTISIIFGAISGYAGGIFGALKRSDIFVKCSGSGAIINIILNMVMVPYYGVLGAAVATTISYWVVYLVSIYYLNRYMNIKLFLLRDNLSYFALFIQGVLLLVFQNMIIPELIIHVVILFLLLSIYRNEIKQFFLAIKARLGRR